MPSTALQVNGDISYSGGLYDLSDRRLKENICPISDPMVKLIAISGVYYNLIATPKKREVGVIAQDVEAVLPAVVRTDEKGVKSVDYARLVSLLIEAVKAQQKEIDALRTELNAQK